MKLSVTSHLPSVCPPQWTSARFVSTTVDQCQVCVLGMAGKAWEESASSSAGSGTCWEPSELAPVKYGQ